MDAETLRLIEIQVHFVVKARATTTKVTKITKRKKQRKVMFVQFSSFCLLFVPVPVPLTVPIPVPASLFICAEVKINICHIL